MVVVITGASKGIGRAIAEKFASAGAILCICARSAEQLLLAAAEITEKHQQSKVYTMAADLGNKAEALAFGKFILESAGRVDVLVNNAGSFLPGSVHAEDDGVLEKMINTNLYSAYHLTRVLLPGMMKASSGHIFNMCSIASLQAYSNGGSYSISKFALAGFSKNLREEMKPHNIKVTAVYPGAVYTDSWSGSGVDPNRIMAAADVAELVFTISKLSPQACVEELVLRPQLGDL